MAFDINTFRQNLNNYDEVSRSDKFDVFITVPTQVAAGSGYGMQQLSLQCEVSELPGRDIQMIEYRHYGFTKRIPHLNQYSHVSFTFYCTGNMIEKQLFDRWLDIMVPANTALVSYPDDGSGTPVYESDIIINQYDTQGNKVYDVTLQQAVPTSVSPMTLDWNNDQIHRLTVSFAFLKWFNNQTTYGSSSTSGPVSNFTNAPLSGSLAAQTIQPPNIQAPTQDITSIPPLPISI